MVVMSVYLCLLAEMHKGLAAQPGHVGGVGIELLGQALAWLGLQAPGQGRERRILVLVEAGQARVGAFVAILRGDSGVARAS